MNPLRPLRQNLCAPLAGALLGASALLSVRQVVAEESAAERLFREGRALLVEQRFAEACPKLEESQRLEPSLGTKLNVAFCHERLGDVATAWVGFHEALITARTAGDAAREAFARARLDALAPRVPWLRVRVSAGDAGADQVAILLDGAALDPVAWDKELPVDPGEHVVAAAHQGEVFWQTTVALRESERVDVAVPAPAPAEAEAAPAPAPAERTPAAAPWPARRPTARLPTAPAARLPAARLLPDAPRDGAREERSARSAAPGAADRMVYEVGGFMGYLWLDADTTGGCTTSYGQCYFSLSAGSFLAGATGFIGYTATERLDLGLRAQISLHSSAGVLIALGPSVSYPLGEQFRVGSSLLFGTATQTGQAYEQGTSYFTDMTVEASVPLGFSLGLGAELGMKLMDGPSGALFLQTTPLFLVGVDGVAASLPLGVIYRWD
ncbi:hypothetical protein WME89_06625 [Sorangium sp. So ce321]|uniref:hypothetical protein n=1 Tax=Sorangium sp. So ce321 TaxID=3133300 RepID=UPI003F60ECD5